MHQLLPSPLSDIDPVQLVADDLRPTPTDRPWLVVNMVSSIDGAIEVEGRSGGLGSPADKAMFNALRQLPDVILAGAGTVRAENYGPVQLDENARARRVTRGQQAVPRLAVVTGSANLDPNSRLFSDPIQRPILITSHAAPPGALARLSEVAEIIVAGTTSVDLRDALQQLRQKGTKTVLCEGGPILNNHLLEEGLIDEWCQTIAPVLTGGDAARGAYGSTPGVNKNLRLARVLVDENVLLLRYARES
ncbi:MAG: pyrimidine reductase family protein [Acidimicrobiales bacterium]